MSTPRQCTASDAGSWKPSFGVRVARRLCPPGYSNDVGIEPGKTASPQYATEGEPALEPRCSSASGAAVAVGLLGRFEARLPGGIVAVQAVVDMDRVPWGEVAAPAEVGVGTDGGDEGF